MHSWVWCCNTHLQGEIRIIDTMPFSDSYCPYVLNLYDWNTGAKLWEVWHMGSNWCSPICFALRLVPQVSRLMTNQQNTCAPSKDSDQPGHPPSLISVFAVRMKKPWVLTYPLSAQRRLWSDWADAQAELSLLVGNPIGKKTLIFTFDGKIEYLILPMLILFLDMWQNTYEWMPSL